VVEKANAFRHFIETEYQFSYWASQQRDRARRRPVVTPARIFTVEVHQPVVGLDSLLAVDQWVRIAPSQRVVGPPADPRCPGSDSTLLRALGAWEMEPLRQASYALHRQLCERGRSNRALSSGRSVRLAVVDGSDFGGVWASVLGFAGEFYYSVDVQRYAGRGHELTASRQLLDRATERLGEGFATHVLYDGLMAVRDDFARACRHWGMHLVVKTSEVETLSLLADTRALWAAMTPAQLRQSGVEVVAGTDEVRARTYTIYAQGGLHWEGLPLALKLAWVRETHLKGKYAGQTFEFWVMTTDESLSAEELRELAHARWVTENNGFKCTNAAVGSKKAYLKDAAAKETLLLLWGIGLALRQAFRLWLENQEAWRDWTVKKTLKFLSRCILSSVLDDEVLGCGGSP
jgi:hypothetical protein